MDEAENTNMDCAVTRHIRRARALDMDYTGPDELEGTRRVAADMGGSNIDNCSSIDVDLNHRAIVAGTGDTGNGLSGFLIRLPPTAATTRVSPVTANSSYAIWSAFTGAQTRLNHVVALATCASSPAARSRAAAERRMFVMRVTSAGQLDTSFNTTGIRELDFNGAGTDDDSCARVLVLPGGDLIAGGITSGGSGNGDYALARLNNDGSLDTGFSGNSLLVVPNGSQLAATPVFTDLGYDAVRNRVLFSCWLSSELIASSGCVTAIDNANGTLDASFADGGRFVFRYSDYSSFGISRSTGATRTRRLLVREDGVMYVLGTHLMRHPIPPNSA